MRNELARRRRLASLPGAPCQPPPGFCQHLPLVPALRMRSSCGGGPIGGAPFIATGNMANSGTSVRGA